MGGCVDFCYCGSMTEGRRSQVVLLDERRLEILIQPKLYAGELLDLVASHFNLKEKEYFGLAFQDETEHFSWLQLDRRVLEHDIPKKNIQSPLVFHFLVKFFIESVSQLRDSISVELFYLQAKSLVFKGQIEVDSDTAFQLAAHVLQATHGDHVDDQTTRNYLKKLPVLPTETLKEHPSLSYCEDKVIAHYKKLSGQTKGWCIVNYMTIVESLPTYGVHYFEVKDKGNIPWWLGLSYKGVAQYDHSDKKTPRKVFPWKYLENLYFRDKKFSIEVHDPKRVVHALSSFNLYEDAIEEPLDALDELSDAITHPTTQVSVSRRTFGAGNVTVHVWFAASPHLTRCIWSMAISQHQFYLDRKQNKLSPVRSLTEIAADLSANCLTLPNENKLNNNTEGSNTGSLPRNIAAAEFEVIEVESEVSRAARLEMLAALKARKEALEAKLYEKTDELKLLCVKEAELTGELPPELPLAPGEALPQFRKRVGTAFSLPENLLNRLKSKEEEVLQKLELEFEIQTRIASAAYKLANDGSAKKNLRKQRKLMYQQSHVKLKDIEARLIAVRRAVAQKKIRNQVKKKQPRPSSDGEDNNDDSHSHSTDENELVFPTNSPAHPFKLNPSPCIEDANNQVNEIQNKCDTLNVERPPLAPSPGTSSTSSSSIPAPHTHPVPPSPNKQRANSSGSRTSSPVSSRFTASGYIPSAVYQTKSAYRMQQYPTFSTRSHSSSSYSPSSHSDYDNLTFTSGSLNPAYRNKYDAIIPMDTRGMYSVPRQRTSQAFPSQEDLDTLSISSMYHNPHHHHQNPHHQQAGYHQYHPRTGRHPSFNQNRYGSLDRTLYGSHVHHSNSSSPNPPVKIESRSLDNLDYSVHQDCRASPNPSGSGSRDTFDFGLSQDYLECPISPHFVDNSIVYSYDNLAGEDYSNTLESVDESQQQEPREPSGYKRPTYLNCAPVDWGYANTQHESHYARTAVSPSFSQVPRDSAALVYVPQDDQVNPRHRSDEISPRVKQKEWYETSLDSPLPVRKNVVDGKPPKVPQPTPVSASIGRTTPTRSTETDTSPMFVHVPCETPQNHVVVTMGQFQPYREVTKPYELSDYYKYSTKVRRQSQGSTKSESETSPSNAASSVSSLSGSGIRHPTDLNLSYSSGSRPNSPFTSPVSPAVPRSPFVKSRHELESPKLPRNQHPNFRTRSPSPFAGSLPPQQTQAGVLYSTPHQGTYKPLQPMTCEPLKDSASTPASPMSPNSGSQRKSQDSSFPHATEASLADAFHDEMLAWYEDQDVVKQATLV